MPASSTPFGASTAGRSTLVKAAMSSLKKDMHNDLPEEDQTSQEQTSLSKSLPVSESEWNAEENWPQEQASEEDCSEEGEQWESDYPTPTHEKLVLQESWCFGKGKGKGKGKKVQTVTFSLGEIGWDAEEECWCKIAAIAYADETETGEPQLCLDYGWEDPAVRAMNAVDGFCANAPAAGFLWKSHTGIVEFAHHSW